MLDVDVDVDIDVTCELHRLHSCMASLFETHIHCGIVKTHVHLQFSLFIDIRGRLMTWGGGFTHVG